jgi:hypothetical protein
MGEYPLLLLAHLVLFAYWLGGDVGVFYSSFRVCDPALTREARLAALGIMLWVDMVPRYCLVLTVPVGLSLSAMLGWWPLPRGALPVVWLASAAWLWMVWAIHHFQGRPLAETLRRVDFAVRVVVIVAMVGIGAAGLAGAGPIAQGWLAAKALLFGLLVLCGLLIRIAIQPFGPAFAEIVRHGSTPDAEARLSGSIRRARPFVVLIWIGLVAMAYLGAVKPPLG